MLILCQDFIKNMLVYILKSKKYIDKLIIVLRLYQKN